MKGKKLVTIDEKFLKTTFYRDEFSLILCPNCQHDLYLDEKTLAEGETAVSLKAELAVGFDVDIWDGRFSCLLRCMNCAEAVAVAGRCSRENWVDEESNLKTWTLFEPLFFQSAPHIFLIPQEVPAEVSAEVIKSFELFWLDTSASANRVRVSVEKTVSHFGVNETSTKPTGEVMPIFLQSRIDMLKRTNPDVSDELHVALVAVKWLGNAGSHSSDLTRKDLLDAYEMLEHIFQELFVRRGKKIKQMADEINNKKGPRSVP